MADDRNLRESSLIWLQTSEGQVVGIGFFYSLRQVICPASSVAAALGIKGQPPAQAPDREIPVYTEGRPVQFAHVEAWSTLQNGEGVDFAVLEFNNEILSPGSAARLGILDLTPGTVIDVMGFLPGVGSPISTPGTVGVEINSAAVQVADDSPDRRLSMPGYNGAPVWDKLSESVIAVLSVQEDANGNPTPLLVPIEALARRFPGLPVRIPDENPGPLFDVPELPAHYYDRPDDYNRLRAAVLSGRVLPKASRGTTSITLPAVRSDTGPTETLRSERIVLQGMPGIGKSVLAAALARDRLVRRLFPDGIFWVHLGPNPDILLLQARIAVALGEGHAAFSDISQGRRVLRSLLQPKSCLIILDDVWEHAHARAFDCMGREGLLLLTARNVGLAGELRAHRIPLNQMNANDGAELLRRWAGSPVNTSLDQLINAASACSYIPVVLKLFAPLLPQNPDYWTAVIVRLNSVDYSGLASRLPHFSFPILLRAIRLAWDSLPINLRARYLDLAVYPFSVPIDVRSVKTFWKPLGMSALDVQDVLQALADRALLDAHYDASGVIDSISLHGLQAHYLRTIAGAQPVLHQRFLAAYGSLPPADDGYILNHLVHHLIAAGSMDELRRIIFDFDFLHRRLASSGLDALLSDFQACLTSSDLPGRAMDGAIHSPSRMNSWEGGALNACLVVVDEALRCAAPRLRPGPASLAGQLLGRFELLVEQDSAALQGLISGAIQDQKTRPEVLLPQQVNSLINRVKPFLDDDLSKKLASASPVQQRRVATLFVLPNSDPSLLLARMEVYQQGDFLRLLAGARAWRGKPWLRPLLAALTMPGCELSANLPCSAQPSLARISLSGRRAVAGLENGEIGLWDLGRKEQIQSMKAHEGGVSALAVMPDGQRFLSGGNDERILIWRMSDGEWLGSLAGHSGRVLCLAVSPDNRKAVSGSSNGQVFIWDLETGQLMRSLEMPGPVSSVVILPGSLQAVSAGLDIRVWDLETGYIIFTLTEHTAPVTALGLSSNGQLLASASEDGTIRIWDVGSGRHLHVLHSQEGPLTAVEFIPGTPYLISASLGGRLVIWDFKINRVVRSLSSSDGSIRGLSMALDGRNCLTVHSNARLRYWNIFDRRQLKILSGHFKAVQAVALHPNGRLVVSGSEDGSIRLWDAATGNQLSRYDLPGQIIYSVSSTPDGRFVMAGLESGQLALLPLTPGYQIIGTAVEIFEAHAGPILAIDISPDGSRVVTGSADSTVWVWNLVINSEEARAELSVSTVLTGHTSWVRGVKFFTDGWRIISVSADRTIKLWNADTGKIIYSISGHMGEINDVAILGHQARFVTAGDDQVLRVWDAATGRPLYVLTGHLDEVTGVAAAADGRRIVSVGQDRTLRVWILPRWRRKLPGTRLDLTGTPVQEVMVLSGHADWINRVAVTPDGTRAITASSDFYLREWDISAEGVRSLQNIPGRPEKHAKRLSALAFSPDGRSAASAGGDGKIYLWKLGHADQTYWRVFDNGKLLAAISTGFTAVEFIAAGKALAGAGEDRTIRIWDLLAPAKPWRILKGHSGSITILRMLPGGWRLASADSNGKIGIWDLSTDRPVTWLTEDRQPVLALMALQDGKHLLAVSGDGHLRLWNTLTGSVVGKVRLGGVDQQTVILSAAALQPNGRMVAGARQGKEEVLQWAVDVGQLSPAGTAPILVSANDSWLLPKRINALAFTPGRPWLLAASGQAVHGLDLHSSESHPLFDGEYEFLGLAVHPRGELTAGGDLDGNCHILSFEI